MLATVKFDWFWIDWVTLDCLFQWQSVIVSSIFYVSKCRESEYRLRRKLESNPTTRSADWPQTQSFLVTAREFRTQLWMINFVLFPNLFWSIPVKEKLSFLPPVCVYSFFFLCIKYATKRWRRFAIFIWRVHAISIIAIIRVCFENLVYILKRILPTKFCCREYQKHSLFVLFSFWFVSNLTVMNYWWWRVNLLPDLRCIWFVGVCLPLE